MSISAVWLAVIAGSIGCFLLKYAGAALGQGLLENPRVRSVAALLPVALLAALVAVQTFGSGQGLSIDARLAGTLAAVVALLLRAPFIVVVIVAAAVAAGLRALGLG